MQDSKPVGTPLASHFKLFADLSPLTKEEKEYMSHVLYASVVGSLMYGMVCTHLGISHVVSVVSRYVELPRKAHWQEVKWILWYLRGTVDVELLFDKTGGLDSCAVGLWILIMQSDHDNRSLTGYVFTLASCVVNWKQHYSL